MSGHFDFRQGDRNVCNLALYTKMKKVFYKSFVYNTLFVGDFLMLLNTKHNYCFAAGLTSNLFVCNKVTWQPGNIV